jgi:hypothetical protein
MPAKCITLTCQHCGRQFSCRAVDPQKFCSRQCVNDARRRPLAERFWSHVDTSGECWLWTGGGNIHGYGKLRLGNKHLAAHRVAWELTNGAIPDGLSVLHKCDVRACVRPEHLFLGTQQDNMRDCANKGRQALGERNNHAVLNAADVAAIREQHAAGGVTQAALARAYGVKPGTILAIIRHVNWRHV